MPREWQPNGSHADYWRSDNPLIAAWWRFGDDQPINNYRSNQEINGNFPYLSGMMKDSGPQKHHLLPWIRAASDVEAVFQPVQGIAPWATGGSGCQVSWANAAQPDFLYVDPARVIQDDLAGTDHGMFGPGINLYSGMCVIGWAEIPATNNTFPGAKVIIGRADQETSLTTHLQWRLIWAESTFQQISFTYLSQQNFIFNGQNFSPTRVLQPGNLTIRDDQDPNFPSNREEPFWFSVRLKREAVESNRSFAGNGSGLCTLMVGNEASGLAVKKEVLYYGPDIDVTKITPDTGGVPLSIFNNCRGLRDASPSNSRNLPNGSILDEVVFVQDGFISDERIIHYALSGMTYIAEDDPENLSFEPQFPGSDELIAYWSFDDDDGHNTAPPTLNDPRLELSLSGLGTSFDFTDGIRGGRALEVDNSNAFAWITDGRAYLQQGNTPLIPGVSGIPAGLFPNGDLDEGMTIIGWQRAVPTGTNQHGGGFGWAGADGHQQLFMNGALDSSVTINRDSVSVACFPSGETALKDRIRVNSEVATNQSNNPGAEFGMNQSLSRDTEYVGDDEDWQLWAMVLDVKAGQVYLVKNAKHLIPMSQQLSSASGFDSSNFGALDGFFGMIPRGTNTHQFDDIAVYRRILSIPEMSGFGLDGIAGAPSQTDLYTSQKHVVGYWPFDEFTTYDPTSVSGSRVDDKSWYFHHLTNVSGQFSIGSRLNNELSSQSNAAIQVDLSGSMISLERVFHGNSFDASNSKVFSASGFAAGAWVYLPSGDLQTQGNGSSGLYGSHMLMGAWGDQNDERSWFMGIEDNRLALKFVEADGTLNEFSSDVEPTYNSPFFVGCNFFPSGLNLKAQMVKLGSDSQAEPQYAIDSIFSFSNVVAQPVGASGISFFNAPNRVWGFPSGTRMQHAFMNLGYLNSERWQRVKRGAVEIQVLASGSVPVNEPENISHWRFDQKGDFALDYGREQNHLFPFNTDGHKLGVESAIHSSGATIRQPEYLDTIPGNTQSRRLDLGSGTQSWTVLGWVTPPTISATDEHVILNKGSGPASSPTGLKIFTDANSLNLTAAATGDITANAQNGDLAPTQWNHMAVIYDRDNDQFAVIINGRYAGTTFETLAEIPVNNSGLALGGRGDQNFDANAGGSAFSGILDDWMMFSRVLTLPEISGLAANSYNFNGGAQTLDATAGMWISGIPQNVVSGLVGAYLYGQGWDFEFAGGYISGVSGQISTHGGFIHGRAFASGLTGGFMHGLASQSGVFGHFMHGLDIVSGLLGAYTFGACEAQDEFDVTLTFEVVTNKNFDARLGVEKTDVYGFDARLGVIRITQPPECTIEAPEVGLIASGIPYNLTVQGSGIAKDDKKVSKVRFTFADFKGSESGTLVGGIPQSGLYEASRVFDTPGWYTIKIEVLDSYGYRTSCVRPFLLLPSGVGSGAYLATLPGVSLTATPDSGSAIHRTFFTHGISGLNTTSGILEYTDYADQQESLVNTLEMPSGTQFTDFVRTHDYTMPGRYAAVWAVSGSWGVVSDSLSAGIDYLT